MMLSLIPSIIPPLMSDRFGTFIAMFTFFIMFTFVLMVTFFISKIVSCHTFLFKLPV